jgi:hypothetical protein
MFGLSYHMYLLDGMTLIGYHCIIVYNRLALNACQKARVYMAIEIKPQADVPVMPAWIVNKGCAKRYLLGRAWYACSTNVRIPGPLTEQYLLDNLKRMSKKGLFRGNDDECAFEHLGFLFGMLSQEQ